MGCNTDHPTTTLYITKNLRARAWVKTLMLAQMTIYEAHGWVYHTLFFITCHVNWLLRITFKVSSRLLIWLKHRRRFHRNWSEWVQPFRTKYSDILLFFILSMKTSWHGNTFRITSTLWWNPLVTGWFPSQMSSKAYLWHFRWCWPEQADEQTVKLLVIWGTLTLL